MYWVQKTNNIFSFISFIFVMKNADMEIFQERTTKREQRIARSSMVTVHHTSKKILTGKGDSISVKIQGEKNVLIVPKKALSLLFEIMNDMANGKSITLLPSDAEVTTQQAADLLGVSRPHLVNLLEKGEIPFKKVGTHRRIALKDILEYKQGLKKKRAKELHFLAKQAQELNLGY